MDEKAKRKQVQQAHHKLKTKKKIKIPDTNDSYPHFSVLAKRSFRKNVI